MAHNVMLIFLLLFRIGSIFADNLALLSGTLRTYQRAGCDDEYVSLQCPPGTSISIQIAQYGASGQSKDLCASKDGANAGAKDVNDTECFWPTGLQSKWEEVAQGSWGRTVVEACQKKRQCKFKASPKTFGGDPCPGVRKYVEVAYKCRPYEFRSKIACQNDRVQLKCNPNSRVAVYSASFGRTEYESIQCPQPQGVPEETCLVSYATETVMQMCHGKRKCDISADVPTFGTPCRPESRMYLKVIYTCVPRRVLKEQYEDGLELDEMTAESELHEDGSDFENYDAGNEFIRESAASPSSPNVVSGTDEENLAKDLSVNTKAPPHSKAQGDLATLHPQTTSRNRSRSRSRSNPFRPSRVTSVQSITKDMQADAITDPNCTITVYANERTSVIGFLSEWINAYTFVSQNQERFYLYLILSIVVGILLLLVALVVRLLIQRNKAKKAAKFAAHNAESSLPNGFTDDISEIDGDIDLTTSVPIPSIAIRSATPMATIAEVVRYPHAHAHTHTFRRADSEMPRSLSSATNTPYYYG